jgi:hypothetical protein
MRSQTRLTKGTTVSKTMAVPITPTAGVLSTGFLGLGALHLLAPFQMCAIFGLPCATDTSRPPLRAFIYANGGREVMLSIAFFLLGKQRNREGMRALMYGILVCVQAVVVLSESS